MKSSIRIPALAWESIWGQGVYEQTPGAHKPARVAELVSTGALRDCQKTPSVDLWPLQACVHTSIDLGVWILSS